MSTPRKIDLACPADWRRICHHEAAHIVMASAHGWPTLSVSLHPHGDTVAFVHFVPRGEAHSLETARARLAIDVAGSVGERIAGYESVVRATDLDNAWRAAREIIGWIGTAEQASEEIAAAEVRAEAILRRRWQAVEDLAVAMQALRRTAEQHGIVTSSPVIEHLAARQAEEEAAATPEKP